MAGPLQVNIAVSSQQSGSTGQGQQPNYTPMLGQPNAPMQPGGAQGMGSGGSGSFTSMLAGEAKSMVSVETLQFVGILAAAFAVPISMMAGAVYAFKAGVEYFVSRGEQLAQYSAPISVARAQAQIRTITQDIQEAQSLGEGISRLTDAQSRMEIHFAELVLPIKEFLVKNLAAILEKIADWFDTISPEEVLQFLAKFADSLEAIYLGVTGHIPSAIEAMERKHDLSEFLHSKSPNEPIDLLVNLLLGDMARAAGIANIPGVPTDPLRAQARQKNNTPSQPGARLGTWQTASTEAADFIQKATTWIARFARF